MILFPAVDIKAGKVVRLMQGRFDQVTEYSDDPVTMAKHWESSGAQWLHVVDLDGAQTGTMMNVEIIKRIVKEVHIPIQVGGGVRSEDCIKDLLGAGVSRVILGTKAVLGDTSGKVIGTMMATAWDVLEYGEGKIAVSLDCLNGYATQRGWTETSDKKGVDLAKNLEHLGVKTIIYTDIVRDGALQGPNFDGIQEILNAVKINVIASGGISNLKDVEELHKINKTFNGQLIGAITGKAIYEGKLDFKEALKVC